jgi:hypothetical protein
MKKQDLYLIELAKKNKHSGGGLCYENYNTNLCRLEFNFKLIIRFLKKY